MLINVKCGCGVKLAFHFAFSNFLITKIRIQYIFSFALPLFQCSRPSHFSIQALFLVCYLYCMCAFEGLLSQHFHGWSENDSTRPLLTHHRGITAVKKIKFSSSYKWQAQITHYQSRNLRVGCKSKHHNMRWTLQGVGAIKAFSHLCIYPGSGKGTGPGELELLETLILLAE